MKVTVKDTGEMELVVDSYERAVIRRAVAEYSHACKAVVNTGNLKNSVRVKYDQDRNICRRVYERSIFNCRDSDVPENELDNIGDYL